MKKLFVFIAGAIVGVIGAFGWIIYQDVNKREVTDQLVFAPKNFNDPKVNAEFDSVYISGTLTGKGLAYPNNTYAVSCIKRYKACWIAFVEQIAECKIRIATE